MDSVKKAAIAEAAKMALAHQFDESLAESPETCASCIQPAVTNVIDVGANVDQKGPIATEIRSAIKRQFQDEFLAERDLGRSPVSAAVQVIHRCGRCSFSAVKAEIPPSTRALLAC